MGISFDEMSGALLDAERTVQMADTFKTRMAKFLVGRLRGISHYVLADLKRELKNFDIRKGWKK